MKYFFVLFFSVISFCSLAQQRGGGMPQTGRVYGKVVDSKTKENIEYDKQVLIELISSHFPDFRRILNECQRYATGGKIDAGILATFTDVSVNELIGNLKDKNFPEVRKWVVANLDNDITSIMRKIYDALYENLVPASIPAAVLVIAKYQYQGSFVADQEINLLACLTELMCECEFL